MKRATLIALVAIGTLVIVGCGQDEAEFPDDTTAGGECGPWYPGGGGGADAGVDGGAEANYAVEEGAIFPCAVWDSAMLDGEDTFINVGQIYLEAKHGVTDTKAIVIVIGAENCPSCSTLISAMTERIPDFEAAGALMIGMARRDLQGVPEDPDFTMDKAYEVLEAEDWPVDQWYSISDEENYIPVSFDVAPPWLIIVRVSDMIVMTASNVAVSPNDDGVQDLLDYLNGPDFQ
ncbi:MAG: hypothetical protein JRF63_03815 [Deltaproteobacteria bacterium]|nr:hypothetical protein [Deltaproteobacteria bacterium]